MRHIIVLAVFAAVVTSAFTTIIFNGLIFGANSTSGEAVSLPAGSEDGQIQGDTDCDGDVDAVDGLGVLVDVAALGALVQQEPCTDISDVIPLGEGVPGPAGPQGEQGPQGEPGPAGQPGPQGLVDIEVFFDESEFNSEPLKISSVNCPDGKLVLGGGAEINGTITNTLISKSVPNSTLGWAATAREFSPGNPGLWSMRAYAICGNVAE